MTTSLDTGDAGPAPPRSLADRVARRILRVENEAPTALFPMKGSLLISAVRCVITYAIVPALGPVVGGIGLLATPLSLALSVVAGIMAIVSLRRVWRADWSGRWGYTAFAVTVLVLLAVVITIDLRTLL